MNFRFGTSYPFIDTSEELAEAKSICIRELCRPEGTVQTLEILHHAPVSHIVHTFMEHERLDVSVNLTYKHESMDGPGAGR